MEEEEGFQPHLMGGGGGVGRLRGAAGAMGLQKQNSWSPDIERDEAWERRRRGLRHRGGSTLQRAHSVTDDQLDELRGSLDLGFRFDPPAGGCAACDAGRSRLVETLPALDLLYAVAVNKAGRCANRCSCGGGAESEASEPSPVGSPLSILSPDDPPETVRMRLKQWAQVVALSLRSRT